MHQVDTINSSYHMKIVYAFALRDDIKTKNVLFLSIDRIARLFVFQIKLLALFGIAERKRDNDNEDEDEDEDGKRQQPERRRQRINRVNFR